MERRVVAWWSSLPDGSPGTVRADATDVFAAAAGGADRGWCWTGTGSRGCTALVAGVAAAAPTGLRVPETANRFDLSLVRANDFGKVNLFARLESSP